MENDKQLIRRQLAELGIRLVYNDDDKVLYAEENLNSISLDTDLPKSSSSANLIDEKP
jgi:hypothetical protein